MPKEKADIQSLYFEYQKMEALMRLEVGIRLSGFLYAPIVEVRNYVNAHLLIDLFAIVDRAIDEVFIRNKLKDQRRKSRTVILAENKLVFNEPYLEWYREWRNRAAHHFEHLQDHLLNQASRDIKYQLLQWGLIKDYEVNGYMKEVEEGKYFEYGAILQGIPILIHTADFRNFDGKRSGCSFGNRINLSYDEFIKQLG